MLSTSMESNILGDNETKKFVSHTDLDYSNLSATLKLVSLK
jgi:hypothetical protein